MIYTVQEQFILTRSNLKKFCIKFLHFSNNYLRETITHFESVVNKIKHIQFRIRKMHAFYKITTID